MVEWSVMTLQIEIYVFIVIDVQPVELNRRINLQNIQVEQEKASRTERLVTQNIVNSLSSHDCNSKNLKIEFQFLHSIISYLVCM